MTAFITKTGIFLPGEPVSNASIAEYIGTMPGEGEVRPRVLKANGIKQRYYALDRQQNATHNVYELAALAVKNCLGENPPEESISYLSAGSTHTPFNGPGLSSMLHGELQKQGLVNHALEINSNAGICTSAAQALVNTYRAVRSGDHSHALCVGAEQPSEILKSTAIKPIYDVDEMLQSLQKSKWFMSVFLRSMLSDGAGAFLVQDKPAKKGPSFEISWTHSRSFANEAPVCMKLDNRTALLSQDIQVLTTYMEPCVKKVVREAMEKHEDHLCNYKVILPHISSYFFRSLMLNVFRAITKEQDQKLEYWSNLASTGNTGSASIFIILDEYIRTHELTDGDKILLFIPESGRFNFVLVSLKVTL